MGSFLKASKDIDIFVSDTEHVKTELNGLWLLLEIWCVVCYVENVEHQQIIKAWYQQLGLLLHNTETFLLKATHKEETDWQKCVRYISRDQEPQHQRKVL